ncbi:MAG: VOC family protein [SAR202 cluster bacterium]|nr:VOC family protein [SAR202 cluster bacterium]
MTIRMDHFMYAVPSLEDGILWSKDAFGIEPAYGGEHVGLGTRNALLSLGNTYLEIIAPDPAQPQSGTFGERLSNLSGGGLVTWCAESGLSEVASNLSGLGVKTSKPTRTKRQTTNGEVMEWELLFPLESPHGGCMPFFIDWLDCANPKATNPIAGEFQSLSISTPNAQDLERILDAVGLDVSISSGEQSLSVSIATKNGDVILSSTPETSKTSLR